MAESGANPASVQTRWQDRWIAQWKKPAFRWSIIILAALLFLLGLFFYPEQPEFRVRSLVARAAPSKDRPVEVEARLDKNLFEHKGEQATLLVTLTNRTPAAQPPADTPATNSQPTTPQTTNVLAGIEIIIQAPGFSVSGAEGSAANGQKFFKCILPSTAQNQQTLSTGESCDAHLTLTADERSGTSAVTVFVDWNEGAPEEASLSLGPVKFDNLFGAARWNRLGRRCAQVLRDLMIPIVLALIGIWFNRKQDDREELRRENEQKESDRQQVRILLLKTVMELEKNHYLPIVSVTTSILTQMNKDGQPIDRDKLFFYVLMLLKRMDHLKRKEGGVFFEKRSGEYAAHYAWLVLREAMYGVLDEAAVSNALVNVIGIPWEYSSFLRAQSQLKPLRDQFEKWLDEPGQNPPKDHPSLVYGQFKRYLGVLDAIQAIFRFEGDRALSEGWYNEVSKIDFKLEEPTMVPTFSKDNFPNIQKNAAALKNKLETVYAHTATLDEIR